MAAASGCTHDLASGMNSSPFRLIHSFGRTIQPLRSARITRLRRYYGLIRPCATPRYCRPRGSAPCGFPLPSWPPGSHVPRESPDRDHAAFMPVTAEPVSRSRLGWVPGQRLKPGFGDIHTLSTPHRRFTCVRLLGPHLTGSRPAFFLRRSPPWLVTTAASGGLGPGPATRSRGTYPHLSRGMAFRIRPCAPSFTPSWRTVINVAHVATDALVVLDEVVERVEVDVGEELAGLVADGQTAPPLRRREQ